MRDQIKQIAHELQHDVDTADDRVAEIEDTATRYAAKAGVLSGSMLAASARLSAIADMLTAPTAIPARTPLEALVSISNLLHVAKRQLAEAGHHEAAEDVAEAGLLVWQAISDAAREARRDEAVCS